MWYLVGTQDASSKKIYLLSDKTYTIGRCLSKPDENLDIQIESDPSISRKHAQLVLKFDEKNCVNLESMANVVLTDSSRYGTYINDDDNKIEGFKKLKPNDTITFGINNSSYKLFHKPLIVTTSCVSNMNKNSIKKLITKLCGYLVNEWRNDCSFVIMETLTVTVKVIDALVCQKYIVTKNYFEDLIESIEGNKKELPNPKNYLPPINEPSLESKLIDLSPEIERKTLFKGKRIVFFNESQLQKMQNIIELTGGRCELFNKSVHLNEKTLRVYSDAFVFIENSEMNSRQARNLQTELDALLNDLNKKIIDETEIGLAIIFSSLNKYCNTEKFTITNPIKHNTNKSSTATGNKLGSQTQMDTLFHHTNEAVDTQSSTTMNQPDSLDSVVFQFENKVEDMMIVIDTPEKELGKTKILNGTESVLEEKSCSLRSRRSARNHQYNSAQKTNTNGSQSSNSSTNDFDELQGSYDFNGKQKSTASAKIVSTAKSSRLAVLFEDMEVLEQVEEPKPQSTRKVVNSGEAKKAANRIKLETELLEQFESDSLSKTISNENPSKTLEKVVNVKTEKKVIEERVMLNDLNFNKKATQQVKVKEQCTSLNSSCVVYTKFKPPPEAIRVKNENDSEDNVQYSMSIHAKVKFEPLVRVKKENFAKISMTTNTRGKVNFKKFHKVPKAIGSVVKKSTNAKESRMFKSFKEEPFDVNSQFEIFMNSMR